MKPEGMPKQRSVDMIVTHELKMSTSTQHGYLVIADISGYTSFVAKTELEHSQEILSELLRLMVSRLSSPP